MAQQLGVGPIPSWVVNLAGAGASVEDTLVKGKELRGATAYDDYKFGDLTRGAVDAVRQRGKANRGAPPLASTHFGDFFRGLQAAKPQPCVVWIDFSIKAFEHLKGEKGIDFKGFHDDEKANDYEDPSKWIRYIEERLQDEATRVKVVICNRRHLEHLPEIKKLCDDAAQRACCPICPPASLVPKYVVVTRRPLGRNAATPAQKPKIKGADYVTFDWEEAATIALSEAKVQRTEDVAGKQSS